MDALNRAKRRFWIAMAVTITLFAMLALTFLRECRIAVHSVYVLGFGHGLVSLEQWSMSFNGLMNPAFTGRPEQTVWIDPVSYSWSKLIARPSFANYSSAPGLHFVLWSFATPIWPLLLPSAIIAFRAHRTVRRLSRDGCKGCGYSRAGLAADAPCPECGTSPER